MNNRKIRRIAFLQDYRNRPETLETYIPQIAEKGYNAICFSGEIGAEDKIAALSKTAEQYNLEVSLFTWFMKYQNAYLKKHPEQTMKFTCSDDAVDQDKMTLLWGCPFNRDFQERYFKFLTKVSQISNVAEIWVNDEAFLGTNPKQMGCYCKSCQNSWKSQFNTKMPEYPFKNNDEFQKFIKWRYDKWNQVHGEMQKVCNQHHKVRTIFATSPVTYATIESWITGVDLGRMVEHIDGILTDPYYTFHLLWGSGPYMPIEIYLTESCRIIKSVSGENKYSLICAQSFSHPLFCRALEEKDGYWAGILPLATGIDSVTTYTYPLMQASEPLKNAYEDTFRLDRYFEQTKPLKFAGIVLSTESQPYIMGLESSANWATSWFSTIILPISEIFRHNGLPYSYLPSNKLDKNDLNNFQVILMPGVASLNDKQEEALTNYVLSGGILVAFSETALTNDNKHGSVFMKKVFGITSMKKLNCCEEFSPVGTDEIYRQLPWPDEITAGYMDGQFAPKAGLSKIMEIEINKQTEILAEFKKNKTPAITKRKIGNGTAIYVAGIPERLFLNADLKISVLNFAQLFIKKIITQFVPENLPLKVKNFPPEVPILKIRPLDPRNLPTFEFLPCAGEDILLATIASYFREPGEFTIEASLPKGKKFKEIRELIKGTKITDFHSLEDKIEIRSKMGYNDFLKVYAFFLE